MVHKRMKQLNEGGYRPPAAGRLLNKALNEIEDGSVTMAGSAAEAAAALFNDPESQESSDAEPEKPARKARK